MPITNVHAGALRSVTCMAMEDGATLVSVPRDLFISFIAAKPRTLQIYLHKVRLPALHGPLWTVIASSHKVDCLSIYMNGWHHLPETRMYQ